MKTKKTIILAIIIFIISIPITFGQELGDVNSDGYVDIVDALLTAQYYVGLNPSNFNVNQADVNCSGLADIIDSLVIAQYYVGLIAKPSCGSSSTEPDTNFLYGRGFYDTPFTEVISTDIPDATIVYTLDGSDPRTSGTRFTGTSPLNVSIDPSDGSNRPLTPAVTLRAYAGNSNGETSNVDTQTYIFIESVKIQSANNPGHGWPDPVPREPGSNYDPWTYPGPLPPVRKRPYPSTGM